MINGKHGGRIRGHKPELKHEIVQAEVSKIFFTMRTVKHWNKSLRKVGQTLSSTFSKPNWIMSQSTSPDLTADPALSRRLSYSPL